VQQLQQQLQQAVDALQTEQAKQQATIEKAVMSAVAAQTAADQADAAHGRNLEASDMAHQNALEQQANQAALTPPAEST
jgi:hypothetical protein